MFLVRISRFVIGLLLCLIAFSVSAMRLPEDDRVRGGVAVIDLGLLKHRPFVYYDRKPIVVVQDNNNHWVGVVGIPLNAHLGEHHIYVNERKGRSWTSKWSSGPKYELPFMVGDRKYPTQHLHFSKGKFAKKKSKHKKGKVPIKKESTQPASTPLTRRIEAENKILSDLFAKYTSKHIYNLGFKKPVRGRTTGVFGSQRIINGEPRARHKGFDIAGKIGTPIVAPLSGTVVLTKDLYFTGNTVVIDHGQGLYTLYAHLNDIEVENGQFVDKGDSIGTVGRTGRATGPHLHLGVTLNQARVNPALFLKDEDEDDD